MAKASRVNALLPKVQACVAVRYTDGTVDVTAFRSEAGAQAFEQVLRKTLTPQDMAAVLGVDVLGAVEARQLFSLHGKGGRRVQVL